MDPLYKLVIDFSSQGDIEKASKLLCDESEFLDNTDKISFPKSENITKDWRESDLCVETVLPTNKMISEDKDSVASKYLGHGIIKLFKLNEAPKENIQSNDDEIIIPGDDTMVSILFVPTYFTVHDLLHFYIGTDIINNQISNFRILKNVDATVGLNFMVLIKFKDTINAKLFKEKFNGKSFSKMDPEKCHVVSIKEIVFRKGLFGQNDTVTLDDQKNNSDTSLPYLLKDPFTMNDYNNAERCKTETELPTCPVCLERMDSETTGLITIPCQHTFHCQCLDKWKNSHCPVCRFSSFRLSRDSLLKQMGDSPKCATCDAKENLWACLVCGNIGCGRYNSKHAIQHFESTSHCFAMDIKTQRVWDYAGDNYVHRLVQNEIDGKLVEVGLNIEHAGENHQIEETSTSSNKNLDKDSNLLTNFMRNKEYHLEYVQVLISQLESQREYYEAKLDETKKQDKIMDEERINKLEQQINQMAILMNSEHKTLENIRKESRDKDTENNLLIKGLQANLDKSIKQNEHHIKEMEKLKIEKTDLEEQVKDLMFYLETQEKFKDATEEERNGSVVIQQTATSSSNTKKKKKKKKKIPTPADININQL